MARRLRREEIVTMQVLKERGETQSAIARRLGVTEGAVRYQLKRASSGAVDGRARQVHVAAAFSVEIEAFLAARARPERPANLRELYEHLVEHCGYGASSKSLQRYMRATYGRPPMRTYRRVETPPGAQTQTDWGEYPRIRLRGETRPLHAFVMVLSHSRRPAVVWSLREDQVCWLSCHNRAFQRLGGIAAVNRIDNVKTAISVGAGAWGTVHPAYKAYARSMGFHVDACQPRAANAKGKVESKVRLSRLAVDPGERDFGTLESLQEWTDERIERWAQRAICPATGTPVSQAWAAERPLLRPLPEPLPEPFDVVVARPVQKDCMVNFEGRQYAVPFRLVGRHVEVRGCAGNVQILFEGRVVAQYPRATDERVLIDRSCYEGAATADAIAPPPLGRMGQRLEELAAEGVARRSIDIYAALMEVAR
jgi:transposase